METKKMNISVVLSRNYDKIGLDFLDEPITYETEEELKKIVKQKFKLLKDLVLDEFKPQIETESTPTTPQMATEPQKKFLEGLGYKGGFNGITKDKASEMIKELK